MFDFIDIPLYDDDVIKLGFRFLHNLVFLILVVRFSWHPYGRDRQFAFAAVMLNITVFFICFTMKKLELSMGMALGLFAIFGVLRYRTESLTSKDLTYLFIVVGLAVVNSLSNSKTSYTELMIVNGTILAASLLGEWVIAKTRSEEPAPEKPKNGSNGANKQRKQTVEYDRLELLAPDRREELIADLRQRTHLQVERVRIESINLPNAKATLSVWLPGEPNA